MSGQNSYLHDTYAGNGVCVVCKVDVRYRCGDDGFYLRRASWDDFEGDNGDCKNGYDDDDQMMMMVSGDGGDDDDLKMMMISRWWGGLEDVGFGDNYAVLLRVLVML